MFIKVGGEREYDPFAFKKNQSRVNNSGYDISSPGYGVIIMRPKQTNTTGVRTDIESESDDGTRGYRSLPDAARTKFIKSKNPDYTVKKTAQGATYGVRNII